MRRQTILVAFGCVCLPLVAASAKNPYADQSGREIKALSADDVEGLSMGKGMGYAKAAELNGFPGPLHVLELSEKLKLTATQKAKTQAVFDAMQKRSAALGKQIVEKEKELDKLFATGSAEEKIVNAVTQEIATLQGQLRYSHLQAHLEQKRILDAGQVKAYAELRGYGKGGHDGHEHHHSGKHPH